MPVAAASSDASPRVASGKLTGGGTLVLTIASSYVKGSILGYFYGYEGQYTLREAGEGDSGTLLYQITGAPAGTYDLLVFAGTPPTTDMPQGQAVSARIGGIEIPASGARNLTAPILQKGAVIKGKGALLEVTPPVGLGVRLPGTHFHAAVESDGSYEITNVPLGRYSLEFDCDGYQNGMIAQLDVTQATVGDIAAITLMKPGFNGTGFSVVQKDGIVKGKEATLIMVPPVGAHYMKISENPTLKDAAWQPLVTTVTHSFSALGDKSLFVQFSDKDQMNPSAIYASSFTLAAE